MSIAEARELAKTLHRGQVDKAGEDYFSHVHRVAELVRANGGDVDQQIAAYLHDVIEDGKATVAALRSLGVPSSSIDLVLAVTHWDGESREDYIDRVAATPDAVLIKLCDIQDNTSSVRLDRLDTATRTRLQQKYRRDIDQLSGNRDSQA